LKRTDRLLEVAAELMSRRGYDKTSIADITRAARVSKGSFYLSFASKDALFERLLLREMRLFAEVWFAAVEEHPRRGTLGAMYASLLRALDERPFMAMIFRRDRDLLGRYLERPDNFFRTYGAGQPTRHEVVTRLQEVGAVRDDVDPQVVAHIMNILAHGMFAVGEIAPGAPSPPMDAVITGVAMIMDRALTPADGGDREAGMRVMREVFQGGRDAFQRLEREVATRHQRDSEGEG
jgi:TetR/AcrR family acrAB operon transcriptional repressor